MVASIVYGKIVDIVETIEKYRCKFVARGDINKEIIILEPSKVWSIEVTCWAWGVEQL